MGHVGDLKRGTSGEVRSDLMEGEELSGIHVTSQDELLGSPTQCELDHTTHITSIMEPARPQSQPRSMKADTRPAPRAADHSPESCAT